MNNKQIKSLVKPNDQASTTFNAFKRFLKILPELTNEQLAISNFEVYHEAHKRRGQSKGEE